MRREERRAGGGEASSREKRSRFYGKISWDRLRDMDRCEGAGAEECMMRERQDTQASLISCTCENMCVSLYSVNILELLSHHLFNLLL